MVEDPTPLLDETVLATLARLAGEGSESFLDQLIQTFDEQSRELLDEIEREAARKAYFELARAAHKLAGSAATVGATRLADAARKLEASTHAGLIVEAELTAVREVFDATIEHLNR